MKWQRALRIVIALAAIAFAVFVATNMKQRSAPVAQPPVPAADPSAVVESQGGNSVRVSGTKQEGTLAYDRLLTYASGVSKMMGVTITSERNGKTFVIKAKEGELGANDSAVQLTGDVRMDVSDGLVLTAQSATYGDVTVRPVAQKPTLFPDKEVSRTDSHEPPPAENFIPPAAERPSSRSPRTMPKFEDLPMPAQAEIRQAQGEVEEEHPHKKLSLLQRLANVGLGRRDEETEPPIAARAAGPAMPPLPERKPARTVAAQVASSDPVSEYAKQRPAPQGLDIHGRPAPVAPAPQGDDHLDIPAFLRRQAN